MSFWAVGEDSCQFKLGCLESLSLRRSCPTAAPAFSATCLTVRILDLIELAAAVKQAWPAMLAAAFCEDESSVIATVKVAIVTTPRASISVKPDVIDAS
jgi:hypothetical protein